MIINNLVVKIVIVDAQSGVVDGQERQACRNDSGVHVGSGHGILLTIMCSDKLRAENSTLTCGKPFDKDGCSIV